MAKSKGWESAKTAVVFYAFEYAPSLAKPGKHPLTHIGTIPYVESKQ